MRTKLNENFNGLNKIVDRLSRFSIDHGDWRVNNDTFLLNENDIHPNSLISKPNLHFFNKPTTVRDILKIEVEFDKRK